MVVSVYPTLLGEHAMPKATVMAMTLLPTMLLAAHLDARVTAAQTFVATAASKRLPEPWPQLQS
jgi:hypothetical protein